MPDQKKTLMVDDPAALRERAVDAAMQAVFGRGHPDPKLAAAERAKIVAALAAADEVYDAAHQKPGGKTPHELREEAEKTAARLRMAIVHVVNCAGELDESEHHTIFRAKGCGWCTSHHLSELQFALSGKP
jgi:hypothetical protein